MKRKLVYLSDEEIVDILVENFSKIYCCTCEHKDDDTYCDWCDKQNTLWSVSRYYAEVVADKILKDYV